MRSRRTQHCLPLSSHSPVPMSSHSSSCAWFEFGEIKSPKTVVRVREMMSTARSCGGDCLPSEGAQTHTTSPESAWPSMSGEKQTVRGCEEVVSMRIFAALRGSRCSAALFMPSLLDM